MTKTTRRRSWDCDAWRDGARSRRGEKEEKMGEKTRQDLIEKLRRKVWGLRGLADLMALTYDIDEGKEIGYLGNAIGKI